MIAFILILVMAFLSWRFWENMQASQKESLTESKGRLEECEKEIAELLASFRLLEGKMRKTLEEHLDHRARVLEAIYSLPERLPEKSNECPETCPARAGLGSIISELSDEMLPHKD